MFLVPFFLLISGNKIIAYSNYHRMKINTILSVFAPKDAKFLPMLEETAEAMVKSADLLQKLLTSASKEEIEQYSKAIKQEELTGDKVTNKIFKALNESFITPFDREDINSLTDCLDDVIDVVNRVSQKILLYAPEKLPECTVQLSRVVYDGAIEAGNAVSELAHLKKSDAKFRQHYKEIKKLEEEADGMYERGIRDLFKEETDTRELIKCKEIIQELEKAANKINNVGKVLKTIFVKYA